MALIDNLISYWKFEESAGTRVDSHATNDLSEVGGPGRDVGKLGNAATFNGTANYLTHASNSDLQTGDIDFTLGMWVYLNTTSGYLTVAHKGNEYLLTCAGGQFRLYCESLSVVVSATTFGTASTGTWYLLHAWHDSVNNQLGIAVNAGTADTTSYSSGITAGSSDFAIGGRIGTGEYWDGRIDSFGFWKKVLSGAERTEHYNSGAGLEYPFSTSLGLVRRRRLRLPSLDLAHELSW